MELAGAIITLIGAIVILIASVGLLRMPDVYNRLQVGTKASTLGTILGLAGIALIHIDWASKIVVLILFVMMTNPVSSHTLARVAYFIKIPFSSQTVVNKLKVKETAIQVKTETVETTAE